MVDGCVVDGCVVDGYVVAGFEGAVVVDTAVTVVDATEEMEEPDLTVPAEPQGQPAFGK